MRWPPKGTFNRNQQDYRPTYNEPILGIDTCIDGFGKNMSVQEACNIYEQEVSCKGDCKILS